MGDLTLAQYITEVRRHLSNRTDLGDDVLTRALNIGQKQMARMHDFTELRVLATPVIEFNNVDADRFLAYSTIEATRDIHEIISFIASDGTRHGKVTQRSPRQLDEMLGDPVALFTRSIPQHYVIWDDKFELWPLPNKAYNTLIRLTVWPTLLAADTDFATYRHKDDIIIHMAVSYLYHSLGEYERAAKFFGMAQTNLKNAIVNNQEEADRRIMPAFNNPVSPGATPWADPFIRSTN